MALAKVGPEIAGIRQSSQTEKASLTAMGDDVGLLRDKELDMVGRWEPPADTVSIQPEEAFPAATANATDKMATTLADRVTSQESAVSTLKSRVIPTGRTFDDLKAAFGRYQAFLSPAGQSANPLASYALGLYEGIYDVMGHAGVEGGVTRALMMHSWEGIVQGAIAQPQLDFTSEVVDTNAYTDVRGKASNVDVRMAERYPSKVGGDDAAGDEASRVDFAARRASERREAYLQAQRLRASGAPGKDVNEAAVLTQEMLVLLPEKERTAWSYLVRTEDPPERPARRRRSARCRPRSPSWILAENQRLQTLLPHAPDGTASARRPCARGGIVVRHRHRPLTSTCKGKEPRQRTRGTRRSGLSTPRATRPTRRRRAPAPASRRPRWS